MKIKVGNLEYNFTEEEIEILKSRLKPRKIETKEVEFIDVSVYLGNLLLGYINIELFKKMLRELKKL